MLNPTEAFRDIYKDGTTPETALWRTVLHQGLLDAELTGGDWIGTPDYWMVREMADID